MFQIKLSPSMVRIAGCPKSGIDAIDYRREHGLSDSPDNSIWLMGYTWESEEFVRAHRQHTNTGADIIEDLSGCSIAPEIIARYLFEKTPQTAAALLLDHWGDTTPEALCDMLVGLFNLSDESDRQRVLDYLSRRGVPELFADCCVEFDRRQEFPAVA